MARCRLCRSSSLSPSRSSTRPASGAVPPEFEARRDPILCACRPVPAPPPPPPPPLLLVPLAPPRGARKSVGSGLMNRTCGTFARRLAIRVRARAAVVDPAASDRVSPAWLEESDQAEGGLEAGSPTAELGEGWRNEVGPAKRNRLGSVLRGASGFHRGEAFKRTRHDSPDRYCLSSQVRACGVRKRVLESERLRMYRQSGAGSSRSSRDGRPMAEVERAPSCSSVRGRVDWDGMAGRAQHVGVRLQIRRRKPPRFRRSVISSAAHRCLRGIFHHSWSRKVSVVDENLKTEEPAHVAGSVAGGNHGTPRCEVPHECSPPQSPALGPERPPLPEPPVQPRSNDPGWEEPAGHAAAHFRTRAGWRE